MKVNDGSKTYNAVIVGSPNVNPGYKLAGNESYPEIAADYEKMFRVLRAQECDLFLGAHGGYFNMQSKYKQLKRGLTTAFVDPEGYRKFVAEKERAFRNELRRQQNQRR
jgi:metallo-beta-lactamase class B